MQKIQLNDTDISYLKVGSGLPCLVMHGGLGFDHTCLHPWLDPLEEILQLIYYDHRGNGHSGRPPIETLTFQNFCADADALRQHLGFEKVMAMGHSFGGFIALEYASRYPERVSHLVLLDTNPQFNYFEEVMTNAKRKGATQEMIDALSGPSPTIDEEFGHFFRLIAPLYFYDFDAERCEHLVSQTVWSASAGAHGSSLLPEYNANLYLGEIRIPTLIIAGEGDIITPPSQAEILHAGIPNSDLQIIEQAGHFPHVERPDAVIGAIRQWLSRVT